MQEMWVWPLSQDDSLEKEMATHSSTLTWEIPWTVEPGRLQSRGVAKESDRLIDWRNNQPTKNTHESIIP